MSVICIGITIGIGPSGALLHTIGIGTIIGIGIGVGQWKCTIRQWKHTINTTDSDAIRLGFFSPFLSSPFYFSDMLELCLLMLTSQKGNQQRSASRINRESRDLPTLSFFYKVHLSCCLLWCIHTSQKRGRGREQMGWMKLCGCFHITPELIEELGRDLLFNIVLVPISVPASIPVLLSVDTSFIFNIPINTL